MAHLDWLNQEFLEECVGEEVEEFSTSAAAPPGSNYGSHVTRVTLKLRDKEAKSSFIIKSEVTEGTFVEGFDFAKSSERYFYYSFIPEAQNITNVHFAPKTFPSPRPFTIVLEDLRERGFLMADRTKQLDFDHCKLYMIAAAEFHAASFAVNKRNPAILEQFTMQNISESFRKAFECFSAMEKFSTECFVECLKKEDKYKRVHDIVNGLSSRLWDIVVETYMSGWRNNVSTLIQGDPWITNMMFQYNDQGHVSDIKVIDFQTLRIATPAFDLLHFIWTSANNDVRNSRVDDLFRVYLDNFNANLLKYECEDILSYEDFMNDVKQLSPQAFFVAVSLLPLMLDSEPMDFTAICNGALTDNPYRKVYNDTFCTVHLPQIIDQMEKMGVIDYLENYPKK